MEGGVNFFVLGIKVTNVRLETFFAFFSIKKSIWSCSLIYTYINEGFVY